MLFLGIDVGSSSVKVSVFDAAAGRGLASTHYPKTELAIESIEPGWAEQSPERWWQCVEACCQELFAKPEIDAKAIAGVGITYQMHGLVLVDNNQQVLRPSIIWCDSRAVALGEEARAALGDDYCFNQLLNSPGNFTAAKLRWVQQNEPDLYKQIHKAMLPGDFIAMKLSGEITTTATGLSEGVFWNYQQNAVDPRLLEHWGIAAELLPEITPEIGHQGTVSAHTAESLGLTAGIPITYRAGDQPNNAFSLNVLNPGEVAATAGTSAVIYGVTDKPAADQQSRVNTFRHVTHTDQQPRNGVLLCINGAGRSYSWLRELVGHSHSDEVSYQTLNALAEAVPIGSDGLVYLPFGNGAERMLGNQTLGAHMQHIELNRHGLGHMVRAVQEGIVFALNRGFEVLKELGSAPEVIRAPSGNLFLSPIFKQAFANTTGCQLEILDTDSAEGAARGAALGAEFYADATEAFASLSRKELITPEPALQEAYKKAYQKWQQTLEIQANH